MRPRTISGAQRAKDFSQAESLVNYILESARERTGDVAEALMTAREEGRKLGIAQAVALFYDDPDEALFYDDPDEAQRATSKLEKKKDGIAD